MSEFVEDEAGDACLFSAGTSGLAAILRLLDPLGWNHQMAEPIPQISKCQLLGKPIRSKLTYSSYSAISLYTLF